MRNSTALLLLLFVSHLQAQQLMPPCTSDTLIQEHFKIDPEQFMIPIPTGNDLEWVNFDQDKNIPAEGQAGNWYFESDLADTASGNNCFTSVSWFTPPGRNRNWLILPPLVIPDSNYWLCWRSQPFQGPSFLDGYSVLVSTASNIPTEGGFKDVLFRAAEMLGGSNAGSIDPNDYSFSPGYIHADNFTQKEYFFIEQTDQGPLSRCKFEPHTVSLAKYAQKNIYIAFFHDSRDDHTLQLDDIVVAKAKTSSIPVVSDILSFNILMNPTQDALYMTWKLMLPQAHQLMLTGPGGRLVFSKSFERSDEGIWHFDTSSLTPGIYYSTLQTQQGRLTKKWIKIEL